MFQEVPLYNEFVVCFSYFFIVILTNNVFPELYLHIVDISQQDVREAYAYFFP